LRGSIRVLKVDNLVFCIKYTSNYWGAIAG